MFEIMIPTVPFERKGWTKIIVIKLFPSGEVIRRVHVRDVLEEDQQVGCESHNNLSSIAWNQSSRGRNDRQGQCTYFID